MAARVYVVVAGESSGDGLAAGLIRELRQCDPHARFVGVTGPRMRAEGCESWADIEALSLFGVSEVIREIPRLVRLRRSLLQRIRALRPAAFIGIDAPAFNTGLERKLKRGGVTTVHYVCPTAWAWRASRVRKIRRAVDLLLAIFPFEPAFFARHGVPATYIGHPLADRAVLSPDRAAARQQLGLADKRPVVGLLPGSRRSEVRRLGPVFVDTAAWLARRRPDLVFVAPMATPGVREIFAEQIARHGHAPAVTLIDGDGPAVMRAADGLLLASGTASLEALLAKTPMVVAYILSDSNYRLARGLNLIKTAYVSMPNLLAGRALVPEFLQAEADPALMGAWVLRLLQSPRARQRQIEAFAAIHNELARGADRRAAEAVLDVIERGRPTASD